MTSFEKTLEYTKIHNQEHLLSFYDTLNDSEKLNLLEAINSMDLQRINEIFKTSTNPKPTNFTLNPLHPSSFDSLLNCDPVKVEKWKSIGFDNIAAGKVGVILLAGGQGTRLGSSDPKGCYDIGLPSGKSLFQLQGERIVKLQQLCHKQSGQKVVIPWYVMTSGPTRQKTEEFFKQKNYFGLQPNQVFFFNQGVLPAFTPEGKIFLETKDTIAFSPDGNGGIYRALETQGVISDLEKRNIEFVHCYCVDNCLVKVCDPVFIGYCIEKNADCGAKSIPKVDPHEQVGVICLRDGKPSVVEYSEISKSIAEQRDDKGGLAYKAANIANHFYTVDFLNRIKQFESQLEYHIANKKIKHVDTYGNKVNPEKPNGIKLELFIFDVFPFTERFAVLETIRAEEFSPLKNAEGAPTDSPNTSRIDIMSQHVRFVEKVGGSVQKGVNNSIPIFEISPLVTFGGEGLEQLSGVTIPTPKHIATLSDLNAMLH